MSSTTKYRFSGPIEAFREIRLPEKATPAGYAALVDAYGLSVVLPRRMYAIGTRHQVIDYDRWRLMTPRHAPSPDLEGHLTFALKYEGVDLAVLNELFDVVEPAAIEVMVQNTPTGRYSRRTWFFYEWLTGEVLDLPDAEGGTYVGALDAEKQFAAEPINSRRHRVRDNLPGTPAFCPLVFRSRALDDFITQCLDTKARDVVDEVSADVLSRTAAFFLLDESRSSYAIEGASAPRDRIQRWGRAIGQAGKNRLDKTELLRLQKLLIDDSRFVRLGFRCDDGFIGAQDRQSQTPIPVHIGARADDITSLIDGLVDFATGPADELDPVIAAAIVAFGFAYIHPFEDGNGPIHRYLIHHILSQRGYHPPGVIFPISSTMLDCIDDYRDVVASYSRRLLPLIDWKPTGNENVNVKNDTAPFYRFFDATPHAEFLYQCVKTTITEDLPEETQFLRQYDEFRQGVDALFDMPDRKLTLLFRFLDQDEGRLSARALEGEFSALEDSEVERIEALYGKLFGDQ